MLDNKTKERLEEKSRKDFIEHTNGLNEDKRGKCLYRIWNSYCECRCNDEDQLFDFEDEDDIRLWNKCCGEISFSERRYGMRVADYENRTIIHRYLSVGDLMNIVLSSFSEIYQYILKEPFCFDSPVVCIILHPVLKEIGILNPHVVGFDKEFIHDSLL